jgi:hypothetical protein
LVIKGIITANGKELMADIQIPSSAVPRPFMSVALMKDGHPNGGFKWCEAGVTSFKGHVGIWMRKKTSFIPLTPDSAKELGKILAELWDR